MIVYDLSCQCGFQFEGWFKDRTDYDSQKSNGLIVCPLCEGKEVAKLLSPVAVRTKSSPLPKSIDSARSEKEMAKEFVQGLQEYVKNNFEDVGSNFANEALKIHFGAKKTRNIRGVTTADEESMLLKEGVELIKIPFSTADDEDPVN